MWLTDHEDPESEESVNWVSGESALNLHLWDFKHMYIRKQIRYDIYFLIIINM